MTSAPYSRLLILGLDALPWRILRPMMDRGVMPCLKALVAGGCSGALRSTIPHQTPSAWTTFMTGVQPTTHGVTDWQRFDPRTESVAMNDVGALSSRTIYHLLSQAGKRVGVVMQPLTFPPFAVNGFLLSGFDSPGIDAPFAHPRELEPEILRLCPEHAKNISVDGEWDEEHHGSDDAVFERNISLLSQRVRRVASLAKALNERDPTDVLMVYWQDTDLILHKAWRWCDPATWDENPRRHAAVVAFFRELDTACAELLAATENDGRLVLVLSDHGQRPDELRVRMNTILMDLGLLVPAKGFNLLREGIRRWRDRAAKKGRQARGIGLPIDWKRTKAFMPYQACTGFIYVNLEGRQPHGSVRPADFEAVRAEVIEKLRAYRDPKTGASFFDDVGAMNGRSELGLPDIYVQPKAGVEFVRRAKPGQVSYPTKRAYAGLHDPDGIYCLAGRGVRKCSTLDAHIVDMAPTLMAALGQPVPTYMEGRVLADGFETPPLIVPQSLPWETASSQNPYTDEQAAVIEARLADLGYLG